MAKPDENAIKKLMQSLQISRQEAIDIILYDSDEIDNEEADKLNDKAKETEKKEKGDTKGKKKGSSLDKVKNQKAKKKADAVKEEIVNAIKCFITGSSCLFNNVQEMTSSKFTFKAKDNTYYSISVTKHKEKPDGYSDGVKEE